MHGHGWRLMAGNAHDHDHEHGVTHLLSIASSLAVGLILTFVPWWTSPSMWDTNFLLPSNPALRGAFLSAFTRGAVTGLGLVNVVLALLDVHRLLAGSSDRG